MNPTEDDLKRDLAKDMEACDRAGACQRRVDDVQREQGRETYLCGAMASLGRDAAAGWPAAIRRAMSAENEVARLRELLEVEPKVRKVTYTPEGGVECEVEHWAVKHLAASLWDTFEKADGKNLVTTTLGGHPRGPIEVTLRPAWTGKKTTAERIAELEGENARLKGELGDLRRAQGLIGGDDFDAGGEG